MPHVRPHLDAHATTGGAHLLDDPHRVVAQYVVAADEDERGGQTAQIAVKRRGVRVARIRTSKAKLNYAWR